MLPVRGPVPWAASYTHIQFVCGAAYDVGHINTAPLTSDIGIQLKTLSYRSIARSSSTIVDEKFKQVLVVVWWWWWWW